MADIAIKMGVDGPGKEVNRVLRVFEIINESKAPYDSPFLFSAYEEDFSDSAIGLLSSMSIIFTFTGADGDEKALIEHVILSFERYVEENGKPAIRIAVSPMGRKLISLVFGQRDRGFDNEERSSYLQQMAEELGLV